MGKNTVLMGPHFGHVAPDGWYLGTLKEQAAAWPEEADCQVAELQAGPPGPGGFDQQYEVQMTNTHSWCPSRIRTGAKTG